MRNYHHLMNLHITLINHQQNTFFKVVFPYHRHYMDAIKAIPGTQWSASQRAWLVPANANTLAQLKSCFPTAPLESFPNWNDSPISLPTSPKTTSDQNLQVANQPHNLQQTPSSQAEGVHIQVLGRRIILKLPKNQTDVQFILKFRYARWEKQNFHWVIPNYPGNLELIKAYFKTRIVGLEEETTLKVEHQSKQRVIKKHEVWVIKTNTSRLKLLFAYHRELATAIRMLPYWAWDAKNKWYSIPYTEEIFEKVKSLCTTFQLTMLYEEEEASKGSSKRNPASTVNYRPCPASMIDKMVELRYSENTIRTYKNAFSEFINHYHKHDIDTLDERKIIEYLRYLVTER